MSLPNYHEVIDIEYIHEMEDCFKCIIQIGSDFYIRDYFNKKDFNKWLMGLRMKYPTRYFTYMGRKKVLTHSGWHNKGDTPLVTTYVYDYDLEKEWEYKLLNNSQKVLLGELVKLLSSNNVEYTKEEISKIFEIEDKLLDKEISLLCMPNKIFNEVLNAQ